MPQQAVAGNGTILDLGLQHRPHPHRLRIAHGRGDRRLLDGEWGENLMQLARDLAAEAGADLLT